MSSLSVSGSGTWSMSDPAYVIRAWHKGRLIKSLARQTEASARDMMCEFADSWAVDVVEILYPDGTYLVRYTWDDTCEWTEQEG